MFKNDLVRFNDGLFAGIARGLVASMFTTFVRMVYPKFIISYFPRNIPDIFLACYYGNLVTKPET